MKKKYWILIIKTHHNINLYQLYGSYELLNEQLKNVKENNYDYDIVLVYLQN